jgi:hypothetical protein
MNDLKCFEQILKLLNPHGPPGKLEHNSFLYARKGILCYTPWRPSVCLSVCLSVRPSVRTYVRPSVRPLAIWFPEHNLSSIWPTMLKLHRMIVHIG